MQCLGDLMLTKTFPFEFVSCPKTHSCHTAIKHIAFEGGNSLRAAIVSSTAAFMAAWQLMYIALTAPSANSSHGKLGAVTF